MTKNNNEATIIGLKEVIQYLEEHPDIPPLNTFIWATVYTKEALRSAARAMRSFEKQADDYNFRLKHEIGPTVSVEIQIPRDTVCKKIVSWECPDDLDTLLREPEPVNVVNVETR